MQPDLPLASLAYVVSVIACAHQQGIYKLRIGSNPIWALPGHLVARDMVAVHLDNVGAELSYLIEEVRDV